MKNSPRAKKSSSSLYQSQIRVLFLDELIQGNKLEKIRDEAYRLGAGMSQIQAASLLKPDCIEVVNQLMALEEYSDIRDKAVEEAKLYVASIIEQEELEKKNKKPPTFLEVIEAAQSLKKHSVEREWNECIKANSEDSCKSELSELHTREVEALRNLTADALSAEEARQEELGDALSVCWEGFPTYSEVITCWENIN